MGLISIVLEQILHSSTPPGGSNESCTQPIKHVSVFDYLEIVIICFRSRKAKSYISMRSFCLRCYLTIILRNCVSTFSVYDELISRLKATQTEYETQISREKDVSYFMLCGMV